MAITQNSEHAEELLGIPFIIRSECMRQLMATVQKVAHTNAAVLITGESGSGKEIVARAIHQYSLRCNDAWVDINCGALPEHLLESELFGYEKGAFSGAEATKQGLFELAHKGTLFLDEVAELGQKMQVKFLRVLDGVPYYRLGGVRKISADVRIIAATNQDLQEAVQAGKFRRDLYYRLNQVHLRVPSLRERPEEIVPLAGFFLEQTNPRLDFSSAALETLQRHSWPGNVRELRNVVAKAAILARGPQISATELSPEIQEQSVGSNGGPSSRLKKMEQQMILQALTEARGHHQKAAELLGISRRTLSRRLKNYGMTNASPPPR